MIDRLVQAEDMSTFLGGFAEGALPASLKNLEFVSDAGWQRNAPATPEHSAAFWNEDLNSLF